MYQMMRFLDEPERLLGLTIDEACIAMLGLMLIVATSHKVLAGLFCFGLYVLLNYFKKGAHPKILLVLMYWYLPSEVSMFFLRYLPPSYLRIWRA